MGAPNELPEKQNFNKRSNKPLMERKRRERINKALDELKDLITKSENKDTSKYSKLEKADILEMAVKHVTDLHQNSNTSDGVTKYRSGFSHCTSEVEAYLTKIQDFPPNIIQGLLLHLHKVLNTVAKENIPQSNHKVKATTDKSLLGCRLIRPKRSTYPLEPIYPQFGSESKPKIQATTVDVPYLPSPPSDCSVSPQPLILTPVIKCEMGPQPNLQFPQLSPFLQDRRSALTCDYLPRESKPLNLTLHDQITHTSQSSPSLSFAPKTSSPFMGAGHSRLHSFSAQEPSSTPNLPPTPPSEQLSPIFHCPVRDYALLPTSSRLASRAQCLEGKQRPTPYPKKDAAKRYYSQIVKGEEEDSHPEGGDRGGEDKSSGAYWRPW